MGSKNWRGESGGNDRNPRRPKPLAGASLKSVENRGTSRRRERRQVELAVKGIVSLLLLAAIVGLFILLAWWLRPPRQTDLALLSLRPAPTDAVSAAIVGDWVPGLESADRTGSARRKHVDLDVHRWRWDESDRIVTEERPFEPSGPRRNVVVMLVQAVGLVTVDDRGERQPQLLVSIGDDGAPRTVDVARFAEELTRIAPRGDGVSKLLLLDLASPDLLAWGGSDDARFSGLLERILADKKLLADDWYVLASRGDGERNWALPEHGGRSLFAHVIDRGLDGAAETDDPKSPGVVTAKELGDYVIAATERAAARIGAAQHPRWIQGGAASALNDVQVVFAGPAPRGAPPLEVDGWEERVAERLAEVDRLRARLATLGSAQSRLFRAAPERVLRFEGLASRLLLGAFEATIDQGSDDPTTLIRGEATRLATELERLADPRMSGADVDEAPRPNLVAATEQSSFAVYDAFVASGDFDKAWGAETAAAPATTDPASPTDGAAPTAETPPNGTAAAPPTQEGTTTTPTEGESPMPAAPPAWPEGFRERRAVRSAVFWRRLLAEASGGNATAEGPANGEPTSVVPPSRLAAFLDRIDGLDRRFGRDDRETGGVEGAELQWARIVAAHLTLLGAEDEPSIASAIGGSFEVRDRSERAASGRRTRPIPLTADEATRCRERRVIDVQLLSDAWDRIETARRIADDALLSGEWTAAERGYADLMKELDRVEGLRESLVDAWRAVDDGRWRAIRYRRLVSDLRSFCVTADELALASDLESGAADLEQRTATLRRRTETPVPAEGTAEGIVQETELVRRAIDDLDRRFKRACGGLASSPVVRQLVLGRSSLFAVDSAEGMLRPTRRTDDPLTAAPRDADAASGDAGEGASAADWLGQPAAARRQLSVAEAESPGDSGDPARQRLEREYAQVLTGPDRAAALCWFALPDEDRRLARLEQSAAAAKGVWGSARALADAWGDPSRSVVDDADPYLAKAARVWALGAVEQLRPEEAGRIADQAKRLVETLQGAMLRAGAADGDSIGEPIIRLAPGAEQVRVAARWSGSDALSELLGGAAAAYRSATIDDVDRWTPMPLDPSLPSPSDELRWEFASDVPKQPGVRRDRIDLLVRGHRWSSFHQLVVPAPPEAPIEWTVAAERPVLPSPPLVQVRGGTKLGVDLVIVIDCSGSMTQAGLMEPAKDGVGRLLRALGELEGVRIAVIAYGSRHRLGNRPGAGAADRTYFVDERGGDPAAAETGPLATLFRRINRDIVQVVPDQPGVLAPLDGLLLADAEEGIAGLGGWGITPLYSSIEQAVGMFDQANPRTIRRVVVITDGINQVYPEDPEAIAAGKVDFLPTGGADAAREALGRRTDVRLDVLFLTGSEDGGGNRSATTRIRDDLQLAEDQVRSVGVDSLTDELLEITRSSFRVVDEAGREVLGETRLDLPPVPLAGDFRPGRYRVEVRLAGRIDRLDKSVDLVGPEIVVIDSTESGLAFAKFGDPGIGFGDSHEKLAVAEGTPNVWRRKVDSIRQGIEFGFERPDRAVRTDSPAWLMAETRIDGELRLPLIENDLRQSPFPRIGMPVFGDWHDAKQATGRLWVAWGSPPTTERLGPIRFASPGADDPLKVEAGSERVTVRLPLENDPRLQVEIEGIDYREFGLRSIVTCPAAISVERIYRPERNSAIVLFTLRPADVRADRVFVEFLDRAELGESVQELSWGADGIPIR